MTITWTIWSTLARACEKLPGKPVFLLENRVSVPVGGDWCS
ncbi:MAG: hypothetical protein QF876_13415 [Desulfobacterales bacterium]|nr:hypothetical protein [Desulfobacterales bacterium]MDP6808632.1 hypothetical protein [Desulfobacterales bacterium]